MRNQRERGVRVMVVGVVIATIVRDHGPGAYGPAPSVDERFERTRAELEALATTIAAILMRALFAAWDRLSYVDRVTVRDRYGAIAAGRSGRTLEAIALERARNIVAGCVDLADAGELDAAWLGVLQAILAAGEQHNGGAHVPPNLVELADEITALLYDGAIPDPIDDELEESGEHVIDVEPCAVLARVA